MRRLALATDTLREIKFSFSRFISIFSIIALGAGFFAGIKATCPDMKETAHEYFIENNLMDIKLMSSIGITYDDVSAINKIDGISGVMPSYTTDLLLNIENKSIALKAISYNHKIEKDDIYNINHPVLLEGRMPKSSGECVVEIKGASPNQFKIGEKITLSSPFAEKSISEYLHEDTFEIVGIVCSPSYIGYERGHTNIGNGEINSFIILPEVDFALPYYTELFATIEGANALKPFSQEYKNKINSYKDKVLKTLDESVTKRFDEILSQYNKQLEKAKKELDGAEYLASANKEMLLADIEKGEEALIALNEKYKIELEKDNANKYLIKASIVQTENKINLAKQKIEMIDNGTLPSEEETQAEINKMKSAIKETENNINVLKSPTTYFFNRFSNTDYSSYSGDCEKIDAIAKIFPVFFVLVAALVCLTTMTRMVEENRTQIGCLKALGYTKSEIISKYLIYGLSATALGSIFGMLIGFFVLPKIIFQSYKMLYNIPKINAPFRIDLAIIILVVSMLCVGFVILYSCISELKSTPAQLMRPKSPPKGKRVLLEKINFIWNKLSFLAKVTTRNLFRYKKRFFMTVVGIMGCTALMLAGFGVDHSISSIAHKQFESVFKFDCTATVSPETDISTALAHLSDDNITDKMSAYQNAFDVSNSNGTRSANIIVPSDLSQFDKYFSLQERKSQDKITLTNDGVIISEKLASLLDIKIGDEISLKRGDAPPATLPVSSIMENYTFHYVLISPILYEKAFGNPPQFNSIVFNMKDTSDDTCQLLSQKLIATKDIIAVTFSSQLDAQFADATKSLKSIVLVLIICAGLLAFIVLYNLANINITERARELATIKLLGFYDNEVSAYIYRENIICSIIGILFGLVVGIALHKFVVITAEVDLVMFNRSINWQSFLFAGILTFIFTIFVNIILHFKLKKINMAQSLKSIE